MRRGTSRTFLSLIRTMCLGISPMNHRGFTSRNGPAARSERCFENLRYRRSLSRWYAKGINLRIPHGYFYAWERIFALLRAGRCRRLVARSLAHSLYAVAIK